MIFLVLSSFFRQKDHILRKTYISNATSKSICQRKESYVFLLELLRCNRKLKLFEKSLEFIQCEPNASR